MNILDITPADIERLKAMDGTDDFTTRDREIRDVIGRENFQYISVCRLRPDYTLPAPTEAEIIAYLKASEVPPSQWHPAAQEWAKRHDGEPIWEHQHAYGKSWGKTSFITTGGDELYSVILFRLRADYGRKEEYVASLMPDNCVWKYFWQFGQKLYETSCGKRFTQDKYGNYCKHCGKPITEIANDTSTPV